MNVEQLKTYFELEKLLHQEKMSFSDFSKPDIDGCYLLVDLDNHSLKYIIVFADSEGWTFKKEYSSKESMSFETVYEILRDEFLKTKDANLKAQLEEDLKWAEEHLQEVKDKLAKLS